MRKKFCRRPEIPMRKRLESSKMYNGDPKHKEIPIKTLWTETWVFKSDDSFEHETIYEVKD